MDVEKPTVEAQLLAHAEKQTLALESLRTIATIWTFVAVLGAVVWLIATVVAG